jgi:ubiquitin-protein ligase
MNGVQKNKRKEKDVLKLLTSEYNVEVLKDNMSEFTVEFPGPQESPYEGVRKEFSSFRAFGK